MTPERETMILDIIMILEVGIIPEIASITTEDINPALSLLEQRYRQVILNLGPSVLIVVLIVAAREINNL